MLQSMDCLYTQGYYFYRPMPVEQAEALLAQQASERYWDVEHDLMCRNHKAFTGGLVSEKSALALQAFQIIADQLLELGRLDLNTGEYRVVRRDESCLPEGDANITYQFADYCTQLVEEEIIHPDDAAAFRAETCMDALREKCFGEGKPQCRRFRRGDSAQGITFEVVPCKGCSTEQPWAVVMMRSCVMQK